MPEYITPTKPANARTLKVATLRSIEEVKEANRKAGRFFFSTATMQFFRSRIGGNLYGGAVFVSSEQPPQGERRYTVRIALADGDIADIGGFMRYADGVEANRQARIFGQMLAAEKSFVAADRWFER
jgi:hypothetical protein